MKTSASASSMNYRALRWQLTWHLKIAAPSRQTAMASAGTGVLGRTRQRRLMHVWWHLPGCTASPRTHDVCSHSCLEFLVIVNHLL
jgi:hypothetical protein